MNNNVPATQVRISGMHCANCALGVEKHLKKSGIAGVSVDFATATAYFPDPTGQARSVVVREIEKLGYRTGGLSTPTAFGWLSSLEARFLFCLAFSLPLLLPMFLPLHGLHAPEVQLALCLPVFCLGFFHFGRSALRSLASGMPNMDVLIIIGITCAFAYSLIGTFLGLGEDFLFYETSATITTIVLFGNLLEERAVRKTTSAIEDLSRMQPSRARRVEIHGGNERIVEVDYSQIHPGDILIVNPGDRIPADAEIIEGQGSVDESMLTGESAPVAKLCGSPVIGASVLHSGSLRIKASAVGEDTVLAGMIRLVKEAQRNKPAIQRLGDRVSAVFVPAVLLIAIATFLLSYLALDTGFQAALLRAIAVLVIACPCAMGLATPTAVMVGIGMAARRGILIKGGNTLETFARIKRMVFDKTGTITTGDFKLKSINTVDVDLDYVKSVIAGLEHYSSHPVAKSIGGLFEDTKRLEMCGVEEQRGVGVTGKDGAGNSFALGSWLIARELTQDRSHALYLLKNGSLIATVNLQDEVKPNAAGAIEKLRKLGVDSILLSGDVADKCAGIASQVGINLFFAEQSPEDKLRVIERLDREAATAFIGDGINDAPSLARASVGISLSDASAAAINSAQIVLLKNNLEQLPRALAIARKTFRTIKENLFWAFFYNVLAIPFAAAGMLNPMIAALAMAASDIIVVGNSLRLRTFKPD